MKRNSIVEISDSIEFEKSGEILTVSIKLQNIPPDNYSEAKVCLDVLYENATKLFKLLS